MTAPGMVILATAAQVDAIGATVECDRCGGSGYQVTFLDRVLLDGPDRCTVCNGTGQVPAPDALRVLTVADVPRVKCPACDGSYMDEADVPGPVADTYESLPAPCPDCEDGTVPWAGGEVTLAMPWCPECLLGQGFVNDLAAMRLVECPAHGPRIAGVLRVTVEALPIVDALTEPFIAGEYPYVYVVTNDDGAQVLLYLVTGPDEEADWQDRSDWLSTGQDFTPGRFALVLSDPRPVDPPITEVMARQHRVRVSDGSLADWRPCDDDVEASPDRRVRTVPVPLALSPGVVTPVTLPEEARHG